MKESWCRRQASLHPVNYQGSKKTDGGEEELDRRVMEEYVLRSFVLLIVASLSIGVAAGDVSVSPKLLLTPQRLRRLQRDRERQTQRWINFEKRVQSVPDSPERGFELALYYAVTQDEVRGREAVAWAKAHPCERRQAALILDWCRGLVPDGLDAGLPNCPTLEQFPLAFSEAARDRLFMEVAEGKEASAPDRDAWRKIQGELEKGGFADAKTLYAASEYLSAVRTAQHSDLRLDDTQFFARLPTQFLLSMTPAELEKPSRMEHIAALALVSLDPNLEGSQFVQGWAIEDGHALREGPGLAYELLWADSYLPGVGYQNLDPWVYDPNGRLLARASWEPNACWIDISVRGVEQQNCPPGWRNQAAQFGHMRLIPVAARCVEVPQHGSGEQVLLWNMKPRATIAYPDHKQHQTGTADPAGLFAVPLGVAGKVCIAQ